jgi:hypothetical protein
MPSAHPSKHHAARDLLATINLLHPAGLQSLLDELVRPIEALFEQLQNQRSSAVIFYSPPFST